MINTKGKTTFTFGGNTTLSKSVSVFYASILLVTFFFINAAHASQEIQLVPNEKSMVERGEIVSRELTDNSQDGKTFEAIASFQAPYQNVYRVLTDFSRYPEFMPNISSVEVLSQNSKEAMVNFILGLPLGKVKKYRLQLHFSENESNAAISWRMIDWPEVLPKERIKDTSGYWLLEPFPGRTDSTLALYHVFTDPGKVPFGMDWIVDIISESSLPKTIQQTRERVSEISN